MIKKPDMRISKLLDIYKFLNLEEISFNIKFKKSKNETKNR